MDVMRTAAAVLFPDFYSGDRDTHPEVGARTVYLHTEHDRFS